jgi:tripartite-type tricarboxylate transporter receptor subunit TctC
MKSIGVCCLLACTLGGTAAVAQDGASFQGKTVTMIIGSAPGGGTDAFGRLTAPFLTTHLPGAPSIVPRNIPGADGITAMNYMVQQAAPDGYTIIAVPNTVVDPLNYRKPQSHFDPSDFAVFGGAGRGGEVLLINKDSEKRLYDKQAAPIVMGSLGGIPRSGMQMTAWGVELLGWNAKWVIGYRGTNELMLALERGEIDMTATGNLFLIQKLIETGRFKILVQSGALKNGAIISRPDFGDAPILAKTLEGKLNDPLASQAFEYWSSIAVTDKWLALPPKSPKAILDVYRDTYSKIIQDPEFIDRSKKISDDFVPMLSGDVETLIKKLASLSPQAIDYMTVILRKQGLQTQ